ncbi:hypothetical protein M0802_011707 [Mischocyttarus mexicanus]|nr:hypothetical protein M0802_011707 [Mischocyttarus mexicanus]
MIENDEEDIDEDESDDKNDEVEFVDVNEDEYEDEKLTTKMKVTIKIRKDRLFGDESTMDVKNVLFEMIRPTEVLATKSTGECIPGSKATTFIP